MGKSDKSIKHDADPLGDDGSKALYLDAESKANRYNARCLLVLAGMMVACDLLNELGIFIVDKYVMRIGCGLGLLFYLLPVAALFASDRIKKAHTHAEYTKSFKYFLLICTYLGTMVTCVTLTHHTLLVMAVPILIAAQYRNTKELVPLLAVLATVCVLLGVYGGFFWGLFDANLMHQAYEPETATDLTLRLASATPTRMKDLFTHYALPREIIMISLLILATGISRRNNDMLKKQMTLQSDVKREMERTNTIQWQIIDGMANLIENRDANTGEHVKRTSYYTDSIARELSRRGEYKELLTEEKIITITKAAPLHDIGKILVSDRILQKPGRLSPEEFEEIKKHASEGEKVIRNVLGSVEGESFLRVAAEISGQHHERWDGGGYPLGLKGNDIALPARIMAVADVFDALVSERVYKAPIPAEKAFLIIQEEAGKQFDPDVAAAFICIKPQILQYLSAN